jgi:fructokinase
VTSDCRVLVVGEVLVDLLPAGPAGDGAMPLEGRFGGSPANVAVGLARLEAPVRFAGRLAKGGYGPWLRRHLEGENVDLSRAVAADEPCTLAVVTLARDGVATYEFYGPGSADWQWRPSELPDPETLAGDCVHTGSLATALSPGAAVLTAWLGRLRERDDVVVSYDPNIRPSLVGDVDRAGRMVAAVLAHTHLVKASEEDVSFLRPGLSLDDVARSWLTPSPAGAGPELVVITMGEQGAKAWHRDGRTLQRRARPVDVVDTVGAGDSFTAGLLAALRSSGWLSPRGLAALDDDALAGAIDYALAAAAITCSRAGADPPRRPELPDGAGSVIS